VHLEGVLVRLVVLQTLILVIQVLYGSAVQATGDFHKLQEVQNDLNIVITKCGPLMEEHLYMVMQEEEETGVQETSQTLDHVSNV